MQTVRNWAPVVAWMSAIFLFSTDIFSDANTSSMFRPFLSSLLTSLTIEQIEWIHFLVRKFGHWIAYFILCQLLMGAFTVQFPLWNRSRRLFWGLVWATLYAAGDEWHQRVVPSRSASVFDVLIDSFGALCGALWFERGYRMRKLSP